MSDYASAIVVVWAAVTLYRFVGRVRRRRDPEGFCYDCVVHERNTVGTQIRLCRRHRG